MPNSISEFAPDLEWMLQSGQVSQDLLLEALVVEYYAPVFRLAYATLDDRSAARSAANQAFASALVELYRYRAQEGVEIWLYRIAIEACLKAQSSLQNRRTFIATLPFLNDPKDLGDTLPDTELDAEIWLAVDGLKNDLRQAVLLHFVLGWNPSKIAALSGETEEAVRSTLEHTQTALLNGVAAFQLLNRQARPLSAAETTAILKKSLEKRWPFPSFTQAELDQLTTRIGRQARRLGTRRRGVVAFMEIAAVFLIILVGAGLAWGMNLIGEAQTTPTPTTKIDQTVLITKVVYHYITATPAPPLIEPSPTTTASRLQANQFAYVRLGESLEDVAQRLGTSPNALRNVNRIPPDADLRSGQRLLLPDQWDNLVFPQPTPVPTVHPAPALLSPYNSELVLQRFAVQGPRYNSLWFDAFVIDYGPLSYIGPPRIYRSQAWESREQSLVLIGYPDQPPQEAILRLGRNGYRARPADDSPWFSEWQEILNFTGPSMQVMQRMARSLFDTRDVERNSNIKVNGREMQAGLPALVLDLFNQDGLRTDRIWYEDTRGLVLRRISYHPGEPEKPAFEVQVQAAAFDIELPQQLFDTRIPWRGSFALDHFGTPAGKDIAILSIFSGRTPLDPQQPPVDFDPSQSKLSFQYSPSFTVSAPASLIELFGDQFLLGEPLFGNPWQSICQRSPDGKWLAFVSRPVHESDSDSALRWFNLSDPQNSFKSLTTQLGVTVFAFSPDNNRLAYFARPSSRGMGILGVVDLLTGEDQPLLIIGDLNSLVWDPEGKNLAMIARFDPGSYLENVSVFDLDRKKITYDAPIDVLSNAVGDWPMLDWGVEFPVEMGDLDECSKPPRS